MLDAFTIKLAWISTLVLNESIIIIIRMCTKFMFNLSEVFQFINGFSRLFPAIIEYMIYKYKTRVN